MRHCIPTASTCTGVRLCIDMLWSAFISTCKENAVQPELLLDCLRACGGRYREGPCSVAAGIDCKLVDPNASVVGFETLVIASSSTP